MRLLLPLPAVFPASALQALFLEEPPRRSHVCDPPCKLHLHADSPLVCLLYRCLVLAMSLPHAMHVQPARGHSPDLSRRLRPNALRESVLHLFHPASALTLVVRIR